jgi:two-component system, cell cycle response regulator DivK
MMLEAATIVIVEDDPNSYLATVDLLKMDGAISVYVCDSGDQVITMAESLPQVDLFLVDIYMPGETGYEVIQHIRQHPRLSHSKVVALTANVMYDDMRRVKEAGFDSFIGKPVRPARFANQVRQILAGDSLWEWR